MDGWTFLLTSDRNCPSARVVSGFADTEDGDTVEEHSQVVSLERGVPYSYTIPDSASDREYASIDDIICETI
ncbi:hypothetical protein [Leifsonia xyli]|uniref:hypothetical protein n=1 Tax=Leifsonia xyli TaxID=1575 RepID=UPI0012DF02A2|nr:hypothetical protein [Leifsonia xyli]